MAAAKQTTTILITGASRGIGLGLVELFAKRAAYRVIATARNLSNADKLNAIAKANPSTVTALALDVADSKSVAALPAALTASNVSSLDIVVNNAGVASVPFVTKLETESVSNFLDVYRTNVVGVWDVTKTVLPFLRKSVAASGARVFNMSSIMGSVDYTNREGMPGMCAAYRASKAALNELSAVQAREYNVAAVNDKDGKTPLLTVTALHPGWVQTDLGNSGGMKAPVTLEASTTGIVAVIEATKPAATANFIDFQGQPVKW